MADREHEGLGLRLKGVCSGRETGVDKQHLLALAPSNKRPKTADKAKEGKEAPRCPLFCTLPAIGFANLSGCGLGRSLAHKLPPALRQQWVSSAS